MKDKYCPYCSSDNVLPFEDEGDYKRTYSFYIIILSALVLIIGYLIFLFSSYIFFPVVVFIAIIITTKTINKREREKKKVIQIEKQYICLNCNSNFKL